MYEIYDKRTGERLATTDNEESADEFRDFEVYRVTEKTEVSDGE